QAKNGLDGDPGVWAYVGGTGRDCYVDSGGCIGVVMMARGLALRVMEKSLAARERVAALDWGHILHELDAQGNAVLDRVLARGECTTLAALYRDDSVFRSRVVMASHGFGRGEYKYFRYPLPEIVAELRTELYPRLAPIANEWNAAMN